MNATITTFTDADSWNRALYAFLAEKERRSGSRRTVEGYSRMLQHFFGTIGRPPDRVTGQDVFAWAYGTGLSGKPPSSVTIGARLACLSRPPCRGRHPGKVKMVWAEYRVRSASVAMRSSSRWCCEPARAD